MSHTVGHPVLRPPMNPGPGVRIISCWDAPRRARGGGTRGHRGIDIEGVRGVTPVYAAADGTIIRAAYAPPPQPGYWNYGHTIIVPVVVEAFRAALGL